MISQIISFLIGVYTGIFFTSIWVLWREQNQKNLN